MKDRPGKDGHDEGTDAPGVRPQAEVRDALGALPRDEVRDALEALPPLPPPPARQQAIRRRAGDAFEEAHQSRTRLLLFTRYALGVTLAGAAAIYLLWALKVARTFG
jgi:hypothetical protein